jgi:importin subunit alpha-1
VKNVLNPENVSLLRNCVWTLSNLCRGKPQPDLRVIQPAFEAISILLNNCSDQQTIVDACWALSYLSDGNNERIQQCVEFNVVPQLVQMIASGQTQAVVPALRTLGNIVSGEDHQTQVVVDCGALPVVVPLLSHAKKNIRKEACWMLSNIAAGNKSQVNSLVKTPSLITQVLLQVSSGTEWDVRKEAAWVISNVATGGSKANVLKLIESNAIEPLCDLLDVAEVRILLVAMEALESILKHGEAAKIDCTTLIDEAEGVDKLELLQEHENEDVYNRAVKILESYFGGEEEDESENLAPQSSTSNSFSFGIANQTAGSTQPKATFDFSTPKAPISFL